MLPSSLKVNLHIASKAEIESYVRVHFVYDKYRMNDTFFSPLQLLSLRDLQRLNYTGYADSKFSKQCLILTHYEVNINLNYTSTLRKYSREGFCKIFVFGLVLILVN